MKKNVILFFAFLALTAKAQTGEQITDYLDGNKMAVADRTTAVYYRTIDKKKDVMLVRDYFMLGKLQMVAECAISGDSWYQHGKCITYYENGMVSSEENFDHNQPAGTQKWYDENGRLQQEMKYLADREIFVHVYSKNGEEMLPNGKGIVKYDADESYDKYKEIKDSICVSHFDVSRVNGDTLYYELDKPATYKGGDKALARDIASKLRYPATARRMGIQGSVAVSFIVDKQGEVRDIKVLKSLHPECDAEAVFAVKHLARWVPAMHHGKPAISRFAMPINFRLGR